MIPHFFIQEIKMLGDNWGEIHSKIYIYIYIFGEKFIE